MDDQQTNKNYHIAWKKCVKSGTKNGDNEINKKLNKKGYNKSIIPAILGRLGKHTNQLKSLNRYHFLNSFRYIQHTNSDCTNATKYWDKRNYKMAKNIAEQVKQNTNKKNLVIVGAGHVVGIKEAYSILPNFRKKGFASEASQKCRDFTFENNFSKRLISIINIDNLNSEKTAMKNGMKKKYIFIKSPTKNGSL